MASNWTPPSQTLPSGYQWVDESASKFLFVDFLPEVQQKGGIFTSAVYSTFRSLVDRANEWLRGNRTWRIVTCESVEFKSHENYVNSNKMTYTEHCSSNNKSAYNIYFIRGLRLWITKGNEDIDREQQIGYLNLVPNQTESGLVSREFETLDSLINDFNSRVRTHPLPGRVINIESQEMKLSTYHHFDPDRSNWKERSDCTKRFVIILRIFYEIMDGDPMLIGLQDFLPTQISPGDLFTKPVYEPFSNVLRKASDWCSRQNNIRFCNAQSIEIKLKENQIFSRRTGYTEHGSRKTYYARILRVVYIRPQVDVQLPYPLPTLSRLTCKTFTPVQIGTRFLSAVCENLDQTKERVYAWVRATGARVISAETTRVRTKYGPDSSFATNAVNHNEYWIYVIRLYMDGEYREPPPTMLPPIPPMQEDDCCVIL